MSSLYSKGVSAATLLLALLGLWLCYLAFSFFRALAFWFLFHWLEVAGVCIAAVLVLLICFTNFCAILSPEPDSHSRPEPEPETRK